MIVVGYSADPFGRAALEHGIAAAKLRAGYDRLAEMGEKAVLATTAAMLAQALYAEGQYGEAQEFCAVSEETAAAEDLSTQVIWRGVRAKLLARDGRFADAETLARRALVLVLRTDQLNRQGDVLLELAEVLALAGRAEEAVVVAREAGETFERKGNLVSAERAAFLVTPDTR